MCLESADRRTAASESDSRTRLRRRRPVTGQVGRCGAAAVSRAHHAPLRRTGGKSGDAVFAAPRRCGLCCIKAMRSRLMCAKVLVRLQPPEVARHIASVGGIGSRCSGSRYSGSRYSGSRYSGSCYPGQHDTRARLIQQVRRPAGCLRFIPQQRQGRHRARTGTP